MSNTSQLPARQNVKDVTISKTGKQLPAHFATEINSAWELYREQLQRNFDLMKIIGEQQRIIEQLASGSAPQLQPLPKELEPTPLAVPVPEPLTELKSIPLKQSKQLEQIIRIMSDNSTNRTDAIQSMIEMLYAIQQLDEVFPDRLYMHLAIPDSTGYRHTRMLQKLKLIKHRKGKLTLTQAGILLMQAPLDNADHCTQLVEQLQAQEIKIDNFRLQETLGWFRQQAAKQ